MAAPIVVGNTRHEVSYRVRDRSVRPHTEAFVAAALVPAMAVGAPLEIAGPISPRLLAALPTIQDIFVTWDRRLRRVPVDHEGAPVRVDSAQEVGCFFSGGIDSWYTLLKHDEGVSTLVFVHGFDIPLAQSSLRTEVSHAIRRAAIGLGKRVIEVETNLREFAERYVSWPLYHGAALASVALLLSRHVREIYIAASHSYRHLIPNGSHPLLDPLWSTESVQIVHDGCEATRLDKVARIAGCEIALNTLRVCWENRDGAYNCGRCRKCLSAMVNLHLVGALHRCSTFDRPLDLRAVSRMPISAHTPYLLEGTLEAAQRSGQTAVARALRDCLSRRYERPVWRLARSALRYARRVFPLREANVRQP